ncbi:Rpn family recombination-promoting nuclease/putative transposase [Clostridium sp. MSJ-8]|uniref:Rpn family recombination-promoting nuclease/putative transposase n=1 Tax=Clostridium sp. MSJ-8 TaxID=2841510 RepID=UPI001C0EFC97|nr:Rpn family recombination-promoting nuclease/putative transposase [Clostridium sp. MSJ-8]MBU5488349.1 Rpn family recombination-promoting nuclease/putative transposase [Clostridium sp. MSJ-8]
MEKQLMDLNLADDFLFAKVMTDTSICKEFLEKLLDINITRIEMPDNQKTIDLLISAKGIRLDVYVKDEAGTVYNIEMQRSDNNRNLAKRIRYYQGNIDLDLITKGKDYNELVKSYIIFICTFDMFKQGRYKYTFETTCIEDSMIKLKDDTNKIILNTKGTINDLSNELIEFLKYVEHSDEETVEKFHGTLVKNIHKKVCSVKHDVRAEVEYMTLLERDREKIREGKIEDAINLFKLGVSLEIIIKATGLSEEEIKKAIEESK